MLKFSSVPGQIVNEALGGDITPLLCDEIIQEYREVLSRPKFKFDSQKVDILIDGIIGRGIFLDAKPIDEIMPDAKDVVFYEVVMESKKDHKESYLVTGNIKHFPIKPYVVTPKKMLDIVKGN